jgi:hypothetical protein
MKRPICEGIPDILVKVPSRGFGIAQGLVHFRRHLGELIDATGVKDDLENTAFPLVSYGMNGA